MTTQKTTESPQFKHDCDHCVFIGRYNHEWIVVGRTVIEPGQAYDLYFCNQAGTIPTVVARFGDEGADYISGLRLADVDPVLKVARKAAQMSGYLDAEA